MLSTRFGRSVHKPRTLYDEAASGIPLQLRALKAATLLVRPMRRGHKQAIDDQTLCDQALVLAQLMAPPSQPPKRGRGRPKKQQQQQQANAKSKGRGCPKKQRVLAKTGGNNNDEVCEIEKIVAFKRNGYRVRWNGYRAKDDTIIPADHFYDFQYMVYLFFGVAEVAEEKTEQRIINIAYDGKKFVMDGFRKAEPFTKVSLGHRKYMINKYMHFEDYVYDQPRIDAADGLVNMSEITESAALLASIMDRA